MSELVESQVLAGLIAWPSSAEDVWASGIVPDHFSGRWSIPAQALFKGWQESRPTDAAGLVLLLTEMGELRRFGAADVFSLYEASSLLSRDSHRALIARLEELRQRRKVVELGTRMILTAQDEASDFHMAVSSMAADVSIAVQHRVTDPMAGSMAVQDLLRADFPERGWAVKGLLRTHSRAVITGPEGRGKSMILYQIAVGAALGIHPFTESPIPAAKVLVVDAENEMADLRGRLSRIVGAFKATTTPRMQIQPAQGWNLLDGRDAGHLFSMVRSFMPDLLIIGPVYQLLDGDQNDAEIVRRFMRVIDECRRISGCAVMTEAHANNEGFGGTRNWRPSGSSLWRRWPEFGIGMSPVDGSNDTMDLVRWRGDRVASNWPDRVQRSNTLPWVEIGIL